MVYDKKKAKRDWYLRNREHCLKYAKQYAMEHPEYIKSHNKAYIKNMPEKVREKRLAQRKDYVSKNLIKVKKVQRNSTLKKKYGIDLEEFNRLLIIQNETCPICLRIFHDKVHPCVDHCHVTNRVRGLLCRQCNVSLGQLGDDKEALIRALNYLQGSEQ